MAIRTVAIIAHVDHGKTSLVDQLLQQSGTLAKLEGADLVMDSNDQERERGITIYAKNTSILYDHDGVSETINIVDTPWHADFGSEVERVLRMVDSVLLVVDAYEGPMPQTKFVLKKSLELGLKPIVVINKIDKSTARPEWVINELFDLFLTLGATDEQADFKVVYASAKNGYAIRTLDGFDPANPPKAITPIFDMILEHVTPTEDKSDQPLQLQIVNLWYDDYLGRLGVGRIYAGTVAPGQQVIVYGNDGSQRKGKISRVFTTLWLTRVEKQLAISGDVVTIAGMSDIFVGETVWGEGSIALPPIHVDEPTLTMDFLVNDSPFMGRDGKLVTSRNIMERLERELETNVWLKVDFWNGNRYAVSGRGEMHLSVLIETMRREGFELQVSAPEVIMKREDGHLMEPIETVVVNVADELSGTIITMLSDRKGMMTDMVSHNGQTTLTFECPTRGLLGLRAQFILMTKGEGILYSSFSHYDRHKGDIPKRINGSMTSMDKWPAMRYSIWKLQERGTIFVEPGDELYEGMVVGESAKPGDMAINLTKNKQMTNIRSSGHDDAMRLEPIHKMSLEDALAYIGTDEYVEVTPKNIRIRKIYLNDAQRAAAQRAKG
jgi:GTP-binding protein